MIQASSHLLLVATVLSTLCCSFAHPVVEENKVVQPSEQNNSSTAVPVKEKLRQDGDGDAEEYLGGIEGIGSQVGQIISGVLGGNFENLFLGSSGFIGDEATKNGVGAILSSVGRPLNQVLISGVQSGQKYFGITGPPPILLATIPTSTVPSDVANPGEGPQNVPQNLPPTPGKPVILTQPNLPQQQRPKPQSQYQIQPKPPRVQSIQSLPAKQQTFRQTEAPLPLNPELVFNKGSSSSSETNTDNDNDDDELDTDSKAKIL